MTIRGDDHTFMPQESSGGECDINPGDFVIGDRLNLAELRGGEANGGIENVGAGSHAQVELPLLGFVGSARQDGFVSGGEDSLPILGELIDCIEDFLGDGQAALLFGAQSLGAFEDGPMYASLGGGVSDGDFSAQGDRPVGGVIPSCQTQGFTETVTRSEEEVVVIEGKQGQCLVSLESDGLIIEGQAQFELEHFHAIGNGLGGQGLSRERQAHRGRRGDGDEFGWDIQGKVRAIENSFKVSLAVTNNGLGDENAFEAGCRAGFGAGDFDSGRSIGGKTLLCLIDLPQGQFVHALIDLQRAAGRIQRPVRPIGVRENANRLELGMRIDDLLLVFGDTNRRFVHAYPGVSQQRLADRETRAGIKLGRVIVGSVEWGIDGDRSASSHGNDDAGGVTLDVRASTRNIRTGEGTGSDECRFELGSLDIHKLPGDLGVDQFNLKIEIVRQCRGPDVVQGQLNRRRTRGASLRRQRLSRGGDGDLGRRIFHSPWGRGGLPLQLDHINPGKVRCKDARMLALSTAGKEQEACTCCHRQ